MTQQTIRVTSTINTGVTDTNDFKDNFTAINSNFTDLYSQVTSAGNLANYRSMKTLSLGLPIGRNNASVLLGGEPNGMAIDFTDLSYAVKDTTTLANNATGRVDQFINYAAPSPKWIRGRDGRYYVGDTMRCEYDAFGNPMGILCEEGRTNVVLYCRDLSNVAWTKTNTTATLTAIGIDGVLNSASVLTATAANGTALQAITLASSARQQSAFVRRITGTGVINMTTDGGATWVAVTVTNSWTRVSIPPQTLANPSVGFRIVTNGDAIAVDFVQNETGLFVTSPILTTTVAVARASDNMSVLTASFPTSTTVGTAYLSVNPIDASGATTTRYVLSYSATQRIIYQSADGVGSRFIWYDGTNSVNTPNYLTPNVENKVAVTWGNAASYLSEDGITASTGAYTGTFPVPANLGIGGPVDVTNTFTGHIKNLFLLPVVKTPAQIQAMAGYRNFVAIGDSLTYNNSLGLVLSQFYPAVAGGSLASIEKVANYGVDGNTTAQMYSRIATTIARMPISIAVVYGGVNDVLYAQTPVQTASTNTNTSFTISDGTKYAANGYVLVGSEQAQISSISGNIMTLTGPLAQGTPKVGVIVQPDTVRNIVAIVNYWKAQGVSMIYVMGLHYMNWSAGGDTTTVQQTAAATVRSRQQAAATSAGVPYIDNYAMMSALITNGVVVQGSASWQYADLNIHLNAYGESLLANNLVNTILSI